MCSEDTKQPTRVFIYPSRCKQSHLHCIAKLLLLSKSQQSRSSAQWHFSQKRVPRRASLLVSWPAQQCTFWSEPLHHRRWGEYAADRCVSTLPASPSLFCLLVFQFVVTCCCRRSDDQMHLWRPLVNNIWWAHLLWWFTEVSNCNYPASNSSSWKNGKTILELLARWGSCEETMNSKPGAHKDCNCWKFPPNVGPRSWRMKGGSFIAWSHEIKAVKYLGGGIPFVKVSDGNLHFIRGLVV